MMFKVGDKVTMSLQGTRWCEIRNGDFWRGGSNPFGIEGTVVQVRNGYQKYARRFRVDWDNGRTNSYSESDLVLLNFSLENE